MSGSGATSKPAFNHATHSVVTGFRRDEVGQFIYDLVVAGIVKKAAAKLLRSGIGEDLAAPPRAAFRRKVAS